MSAGLEIQLIAIIVAIACSLPGVFLVLRKMSMMSDAITHTILLGIVIAFFITDSLTSPFLIVGAALMGVFTVFLTELLHNTGLVSEDSAIGVVFPLLFSIAIIIISKYAGSVHLDTDSVLLGELAYAPFNRLIFFGKDIGPKSLYSMLVILIINITFISVFYKELKLATFDKALATTLGFMPTILHYILMTLVSITAVGAFESVGSILVIAFMIGPPVTAYLLTEDLLKMILISSGIGAINAVLGFQMAVLFDVSIAGSMAVMTGLTFFIVFIFAPSRGIVAIMRLRSYQKIEFAEKTLLFHILNHEGEIDEDSELGVATISYHINWDKKFLNKILSNLKEKEKIFVENNIFRLTEKGKKFAVDSYNEIVNEF